MIVKLAVATGLIVLLLVSPFHGNIQAQTATSFEVASVRSNTSGLLGPTGMSIDPGRITITNLPLAFLVTRAYGVQDYQLSGGPSWLKVDRYDIAAKAETRSSSDQMMLMLQTLLVDRFKLAVHREFKEGAVYVMAAVKNGPRLIEAKEGEESRRSDSIRNEPGKARVRHFVGQKTSMSQLAQMLSNMLRRPVLDTTGLTRDYDFDVEWVADDKLVPSSDGYFDPLLDALQARLGLRLESRKGQVEVLVIDHAEKPTSD